MTSLIISDLHLEDKKPEITQAFLRFLDEKCSSAESLYILGDFFEVWIGDDVSNPLIEQIITRLKSLAQSGCKLYLMHGNRDFLLGEAFANACQLKLLNDPYLIQHQGENVVLMHGDSLCTDDSDYMAMRPILRDKAFIANFLEKSIDERMVFAQQLRSESTSANQEKSYDIMDVNQAEVIRVLESHQSQILIHGHTHRPKVHALEANNQSAQRFVMSDWDNDIFYVELSEQGIALKQFK